MQSMFELSVVIPAYKEEPKFLEETYHALTTMGAEVIIVDDGNHIDLNVPHIFNVTNMGYGYSIKRGIEKSTRKYVMSMDGDGQHTVEEAVKLWTAFKLAGNFDMAIGMRYGLTEKAHRWIGRKCLNFLASLLARHYLIDLNSGMRVFRRDLALGYSPILCDTFSFTTSLSMAIITDGYRAFYFPIDVRPRNSGKSRVKVVKDGLVTLYYIFWIGLAIRTRNLRQWVRNIFAKSVVTK